MGYTNIALKNVGWQGLQKVSIRAVGYFRIAALARILTPSQFGVFGVGGFVLAFLEIFTETGINIFLIQRKKPIDDYVDTAWVVSIIRGTLISLLILVSAPLISSFFSSPDSLGLLRLFAVVPFLRGFINPSVVRFKKELQYSKEFFLRLSIFVLEAVVAITVALVLKSEIGIVWGIIAGTVFEIVLTFLFVTPRPRFRINYNRAKRVVRLGKWVNLAGIFEFFSTQGDDAVVAKLTDTAGLGIYQNAYKISTLPLTEISNAVTSVVFPVYSKIADDMPRLRRAFARTLAVVTLIVIPIGAVFYMFPETIIYIVLGDKWLSAAPVLRVLSVFGVLSAIVSIPNSLFYALGRQDIVAKIKLVQLLALVIIIFPFVSRLGLVGAAYSVNIAALVSIPVVMFFLRRELEI